MASPRYADVLLVTGAVTLNMAEAVKKTYEAMPFPKFVVAVGDDACDGGGYTRDPTPYSEGSTKYCPWT